MTANQIAYHRMMEERRHNAETEHETHRSNVENEQERNRTNVRNENIKIEAHNENVRHNRVSESTQKWDTGLKGVGAVLKGVGSIVPL